MTRSCQFLALSIFLFTSCKKNSQASFIIPPTGIMATINDSSISFNFDPHATKESFYGIPTIVVNGGVLGTYSESIQLVISNVKGGTIVAGIYSDTLASPIYLAFNYKNDAGPLYEGGSEFDGFTYTGTQTLSNHLKVVINSITDTSIIGSFGGNAYLNGSMDSSIIQVSKGTFNVRFQ